MSNQYPAAVKKKAKNFIATLQVSVKVRRYAEAYLDHLLRFRMGHLCTIMGACQQWR